MPNNSNLLNNQNADFQKLQAPAIKIDHKLSGIQLSQAFQMSDNLKSPTSYEE